MTELNDAVERCTIPSAIELENATKENPITWNALWFLQKSLNQPESYFTDQKIDIKTCTETINSYGDALYTNFNKCVIIRGYAGCGKSWAMEYCVLYAISCGLFVLTTSMMARRSVYLGGKHIHYVFCLPIEKF